MHGNKIKFSIIIPCYNEEHYIGNLLRSIDALNKYKNELEVVVVLNNCQDKTEKVVRHYNNISELNIKIIHEPINGVSYARNTGASYAKGDFFIFLDADIILQKSFLNDVNNAILDRQCVAGSIRTLPDELSIIGYSFFSILEFIKMYFGKPFGKGFVRKDIFEKISGFDTSIELGENVDFLVRIKDELKKNNLKFGHIKQSIYCSLRRFDEEGYIKIALPWLMAYLGVKTLKYDTFSKIQMKNSKVKRFHFKIPFMNYVNTCLIYPLVEKQQKRDIRSKVSILEKFEKLSVHEKDKIRKEKLYRVCKEAEKNVPYYRELFAEIGFKPESILDDIDNLKKLPYLTKEIIQKERHRLINENYLKNNDLHERKTGGSTGVSTLIYYSQESLDWTAASNLHAISWTGKKRHMKEIHLSSYFPETFSLRDRLKEWLKCLALNRTNVTTHAFDDVDMEDVIKKIKLANVYYLEGHPSTLYALAEYIKKKNIILKKPLFQVFESTGEVLDNKKRESIEKYIGCRVYNRYGNAEFGVVAHETDNSEHSLKILDSMVIPEVFDWTIADKDHLLDIDKDGNFLTHPTKKMEKIWKSRADLQNVYPYGLTAQSQEFWHWWLYRARIEYNIQNVLPSQLLSTSLDKKIRLKFLIEIVWKNRQDLQEAFPNPEENSGFEGWWKAYGVSEYCEDITQYTESNELVLTTLTNDAMPLIRYRTGDMIGNLIKEDDSYYIDNIEGRVHDMIRIGCKTYPTHYLQDLLDRIGGIIEFQVEQCDDDKIKLYLVVPDANLHPHITQQLFSWWKKEVEVEFIELNQLKKVGWRDKFRYVIPKQTENKNV